MHPAIAVVWCVPKGWAAEDDVVQPSGFSGVGKATLDYCRFRALNKPGNSGRSRVSAPSGRLFPVHTGPL